jgi:enamine deaminase RidA (YjgF/YER057c/UK114 family)
MSKVECITREHMKPLLEPYGMSEAVRAGAMVHLAGQTGMDEHHRIAGGGLQPQALQAFRNIKAVIELAGGGVENLVSLTWFLADGPHARSMMEDCAAVMAAQQTVMPGVRPASTAVRVKELLTPEILVEIQAVAAL